MLITFYVLLLFFRLRENGKKVFLATNSDYKYTNVSTFYDTLDWFDELYIMTFLEIDHKDSTARPPYPYNSHNLKCADWNSLNINIYQVENGWKNHSSLPWQLNPHIYRWIFFRKTHNYVLDRTPRQISWKR